jgi:trans-2,3-dihydro-3-hydroxyanthranilate isomerase
MTDFLVYDVFSDTAFGGNQLAVIPDATGLPEGDLQKIAREFNFSETTFVYPPEDSAHRAKVRIFTPSMEVPFAGHPVIGTAVALSQLGDEGDMTLELGVGPLLCYAKKGLARFTTDVALVVFAHPTVPEVASALGVSEDQIVTQTHPPTLASLGLPFTLTELKSRETLSNIQNDITAMRAGAAKYPGSLDFAQFAYVRDGDRIHARMFAPLDNIPEDPATGSACATLGALLTKLSGENQKLTIHQGDDMGRPSVIELETEGSAVTISGAAQKVMQGQLVY